MKTAKGYVSYDVRVECPHCSKTLYLNGYPYDDFQSDYCLPEDDLGAALFGSESEPAAWTGIEIEYRCCGCNKDFNLIGFEI